MREEDERAATPAESMLAGGPLATAARMTDALTGMTTQLRDVQKAVRVGKHVIKLLAVGLTLDVLLSGAFALTQAQTRDQEISQCRQANVARADDRIVWDTFLADLAPPGTKETPKVAAELARIHYLIISKDAGHNCAAVYKFP